MDGNELKYRMTDTTKKVLNRGTFYQIEALTDIPDKEVRKGDRGGWIQKQDNLSQLGNCWIDTKSYVGDNARVEGDSTIINSEIFDNSRVTGVSVIKGGRLTDRSTVYGNAIVTDSFLSGHSIVRTGETVKESRLKNVQCNYGEVHIYGSSLIFKKKISISIPTRESLSIVDVKMFQHGEEESSISRGGYLYRIDAKEISSIHFAVQTNIKYVKLSGRLIINNSYSRTVKEVVITGTNESSPVQLEKVDLQLNGCSIRGEVFISGNVSIKKGEFADYVQIRNKSKRHLFLKNVNAYEMSVIEKRSANDFLPEDITMSGDSTMYI